MQASLQRYTADEIKRMRAQGKNIPEFVMVDKTSTMSLRDRIFCMKCLVEAKAKLLQLRAEYVAKAKRLGVDPPGPVTAAAVRRLWQMEADKDATGRVAAFLADADFELTRLYLADPNFPKSAAEHLIEDMEVEDSAVDKRSARRQRSELLLQLGSRPMTKEERAKNTPLGPAGVFGRDAERCARQNARIE